MWNHLQDQTSIVLALSRDLQRSIENPHQYLATVRARFPTTLVCFVYSLVLLIGSIPTNQMSSEILPMTRLLTVQAQITHIEIVLSAQRLLMEAQSARLTQMLPAPPVVEKHLLHHHRTVPRSHRHLHQWRGQTWVLVDTKCWECLTFCENNHYFSFVQTDSLRQSTQRSACVSARHTFLIIENT